MNRECDKKRPGPKPTKSFWEALWVYAQVCRLSPLHFSYYNRKWLQHIEATTMILENV